MSAKNSETHLVSARDEIATRRLASQADHRTVTAQENFNARMHALEARFDRDAASIRAAFVAEIAGGRR
jgi:hypothetical protein